MGGNPWRDMDDDRRRRARCFFICSVTGRGSAKTRQAIENFRIEHPEVEMPFPLITTWPTDLFSVPAHIRHEHTDLLAQRLGPAMAEIVGRHGF